MKYAIFLGCTIPARSQHYEISSRRVAEKLGIELIDVPDFNCCGFPIKSVDREATLLLSARNLAIAAERGLDIVPLCSACTGVLTDAAEEIKEDDDLRRRLNAKLGEIGLKYDTNVRVRHFVRVLYEDFGLDTLRKYVERNLSELKLAAHYGCHYLRPKELYGGFDQPESPHSLDELIDVTGAEVLDYQEKKKCCGGAVLSMDEDTALGIARVKLQDVKGTGADALVSVCPFCNVMFEDNQRKIEAKFEMQYDLPVLYYPQVLGLAMGYTPKELGFRLNKVKATSLVEKLEKAGVLAG